MVPGHRSRPRGSSRSPQRVGPGGQELRPDSRGVPPTTVAVSPSSPGAATCSSLVASVEPRASSRRRPALVSPRRRRSRNWAWRRCRRPKRRRPPTPVRLQCPSRRRLRSRLRPRPIARLRRSAPRAVDRVAARERRRRGRPRQVLRRVATGGARRSGADLSRRAAARSDRLPLRRRIRTFDASHGRRRRSERARSARRRHAGVRLVDRARPVDRRARRIAGSRPRPLARACRGLARTGDGCRHAGQGAQRAHVRPADQPRGPAPRDARARHATASHHRNPEPNSRLRDLSWSGRRAEREVEAGPQE